MKTRMSRTLWWVVVIVLAILITNLRKPWVYFPLTALAVWICATMLFVAFVYRQIPLILIFASVVACIHSFTRIYSQFGIVDDSGVVAKDYLTCLYFSLVTFTTLGFGDFHPTKDIRIVAGIEALLGYLLMALFVAALILKAQGASKKTKEEKAKRPTQQ